MHVSCFCLLQELKAKSNETALFASSMFLKRMDNYHGDLTDIIRAGGSNPQAESPAAGASVPEWQFRSNANINHSTFPADDFGDPFAHLRDPLLYEIDTPPLPGVFFHSSDLIKASVDGTGGGFVGHKILDDEVKRPPNIFSTMLQISPTAKLPLSPCDSPAVAAPLLVANYHTLISPTNSKGCLVESSLQISSPRNTGIRRRKSQAKKVVCIPAPAPANSRPSSGEVVPSDLWAWRKYGQKPIKGSPYPRGYYRCSSSKGCSARKQVERSQTDPNMLVITYTSEHNHPWPTQRNALAGSTRSQPSKSTSAGGKTLPNSQKSTIPKEETSTENTGPSSTAEANSAAVKEEVDQEFVEMGDEEEFDEGFSQSYKPALPESINQFEGSFFADLGEIQADSLEMLFTQGFDHGRDSSKGLDPFSFYDWATAGSNAASSGGATMSEAERDS